MRGMDRHSDDFVSGNSLHTSNIKAVVHFL